MNFRKLSVPFDFEPESPEILVKWNSPLIVCHLLKVILPVLPIFGRTLQTATKAQVFASVRNSHRTLQLAVAKHSFLSKCRFTIFREHNNSFHLITLFTRCKHRHQYYIGIVQIFEPLPLFSKSMKLPDASRIPRVPHHLTCG